MVLRIGFAPRRGDLSLRAFLDHWRTDHADVAGRLPGLQRYVQLHPVLTGDVHALGYPGFDACSVLEFADVTAMDASFASPEYQQAVAADEARFVDKDRFGLFLGAGAAPGVGPADPTCWLVTFLRRHPAVPVTTLLDALRQTEPGPRVAGRTVVAALDLERSGREARAYDAVEILQFDGPGAARGWLGSTDSEGAALPLAGLTAGTARLLAQPHPVR